MPRIVPDARRGVEVAVAKTRESRSEALPRVELAGRSRSQAQEACCEAQGVPQPDSDASEHEDRSRVRGMPEMCIGAIDDDGLSCRNLEVAREVNAEGPDRHQRGPRRRSTGWTGISTSNDSSRILGSGQPLLTRSAFSYTSSASEHSISSTKTLPAGYERPMTSDRDSISNPPRASKHRRAVSRGVAPGPRV